MKNFKTILKNNWLLVMFLFVAKFSYAQVVTVPAGCTVKVAGTGGDIALGKVGQGGVVTMSDNFAGGTFTCTTPAGYTLTGWTLKGDLSVTTANIPDTAPTQTVAGGISSVSIQSYNKKRRDSEGAVGSAAAKIAKSKGTVSIGYNAASCNGYSMTFEVYKTYTTAPPIVGPLCVEAGIPCTFSVDQVASDNAGDNIGFDQYYWSGMPPYALGSSPYYSADNSSITFTPAASGSFIIKCCLGRANPWDAGTSVGGTLGTTCVMKSVGAAVTEPTGYTGLALTTVTANAPCLSTSVGTFTINYTSPFTCTWDMGVTNWTVQSQTGSSVTINTNGQNNPGLIKLTVSNGSCNPMIFTYQINRSFATPIAIAPISPATDCLQAGSSNNRFSISASASANPTTWTVTSPTNVTPAPGITLSTVAGSPNSTVALAVSTSAAIGLYTLTAKSTSCTGNIVYSFRVKPNVPTISGSACVTKGLVGTPANQTYTCVASTGATYTWTFPIGWKPTTGTFTTNTTTLPYTVTFTTTVNSAVVTPTSTTAVLNGNAYVTANGVVGCNSTSAIFAINYTPLAPTGVAVGCFSVGLAGTSSVTFTNPTGVGSYYGTLTAAGSSVNSITGPSVNLNVGGVSTNVGVLLNSSVSGTLSFSTAALTAGTYSLKIYHDSCGDPVSSTTSIIVAGNGSSVFPSLGVSSDNYFASAPSTMVNPQYEWTTCTSAGVCTVVGTNSALLNLSGAAVPPAGNQVCVTIFALGSTCKTRVCTAQGTHSKMGNTVIKGENIEGIMIYPNPNSGTFNIRVVDFKDQAAATLYDNSGKKIKDFALIKGENKIENNGLAQGTYIVALTIDGKTDMRQIIIK